MTKAKAPHLASGQAAEDLAATTLARRGFKVLQRNFNCRLGEIDLIGEDGDELVFIEVRYRRRDDYGSAAATVNPRKQTRIARAAQIFLQRHPALAERPMRFDVVAVHGTHSRADFNWIKDAFQL